MSIGREEDARVLLAAFRFLDIEGQQLEPPRSAAERPRVDLLEERHAMFKKAG